MTLQQKAVTVHSIHGRYYGIDNSVPPDEIKKAGLDVLTKYVKWSDVLEAVQKVKEEAYCSYCDLVVWDKRMNPCTRQSGKHSWIINLHSVVEVFGK